MSEEMEFFKGVKILTDLGEEQLVKFIEICKKLRLKKEQIIMKEGDFGDSMYILKEGTVEIVNSLTLKIGKKGFEEAEKSMFKLDASKFAPIFGDMSILSDAPRSASIKTVTDCIIYEIKKDEFDKLCSHDSDIGYKILKRISAVLCDRIRKGNSDVMKLTTALSIALSKK